MAFGGGEWRGQAVMVQGSQGWPSGLRQRSPGLWLPGPQEQLHPAVRCLPQAESDLGSPSPPPCTHALGPDLLLCWRLTWHIPKREFRLSVLI